MFSYFKDVNAFAQCMDKGPCPQPTALRWGVHGEPAGLCPIFQAALCIAHLSDTPLCSPWHESTDIGPVMATPVVRDDTDPLKTIFGFFGHSGEGFAGGELT